MRRISAKNDACRMHSRGNREAYSRQDRRKEKEDSAL